MAKKISFYEYRVRRIRRGRKASDAEPRPTIDNPSDAFEVAREFTKDAPREMFVVLCLDARNALMGAELIAIGTASNVSVHMREVFRVAIHVGATAIVVAHNHPSGDPFPSDDDCVITRRISMSGFLLGIPLLDHVVVTNNKYRSMAKDHPSLFEES